VSEVDGGQILKVVQNIIVNRTLAQFGKHDQNLSTIFSNLTYELKHHKISTTLQFSLYQVTTLCS
jgi:hypothetical protein